MRHEIFEKFELLIRILTPLLSILFTSKLAIEIVGFETWDQKILVICISMIVNVIELWAFYIGRYEDKPFFTTLGYAIGFVSVLASLGYLQVNFERSVLESNEYQLKYEEIKLLQNQIKQLDETAQKQQNINYITRSQQTLASKTPLLNRLGIAQRELDSVKESGAGIGGALYRIFSNIFRIGTYWVAIVFNLFLGALIEIAAVQSNIRGVKKGAKKSTNDGKENEIIPAIANANEVQINSEKEAQIAVQKLITETTPENGGNGAKVNDGTKKKTPVSSLHLPQKSKVNKPGKKRKNLHGKICFEYMQQEAQIKEGFRSEINESEIAKKCGCTRPNVDYHLRKENLKK